MSPTWPQISTSSLGSPLVSWRLSTASPGPRPAAGLEQTPLTPYSENTESLDRCSAVEEALLKDK